MDNSRDFGVAMEHSMPFWRKVFSAYISSIWILKWVSCLSTLGTVVEGVGKRHPRKWQESDPSELNG